MKSVITTNQGTTTTYFASLYYEVSNGVVIKYYMAGAQRVAMRTDGTLNYLLADHPSARLRAGLGSTSVTTNASGALVSELRYKPWGEERYATGSTPTQYRYTSQFSHELDFGLYFYQSRWYDPALGRFNQPDSIVPEQSQGTQAWDRFAYVSNNPIRYNDPSGKKACDGEGLRGKCDKSGIPATRGELIHALKTSGVQLKGKWTYDYAYAVYLGVAAVGEKIARTVGGTPESAFKSTFGSTIFEWGCPECEKLGRTVDKDLIKFRDFYGAYNENQMLMNTNLVIHEIGHMFENIIASTAADGTLNKPARSSLPYYFANNREGLGTQWIWQQSSTISPGEIYADMFVGWVQGSNYETGMGQARMSWMNLKMPEFLDMVP